MNYRHSYHAGNFADVFKHIILVALVKSLQRKDNGFCYLDTHAGSGSYDLLSLSAQTNKEYQLGIEKIITANHIPSLVQAYLDCIPKPLRYYPGSPSLVKSLLRSQDRMILTELHPEEYRKLKKNFSSVSSVLMFEQDGYQGLKAHLPPKERRGLILIDPPYEKTSEYTMLLDSLHAALKRFATGVYAVWYPIKDRSPVAKLQAGLANYPLLTTELCIYPENLSSVLNGSGMLIVNPPFQLEQTLKAVLPWLWKVLSINGQGRFTIQSRDH